MLSQFDHLLNLSCYLYSQAVMQNQAQAYFNAQMTFYPTQDVRYTGYYSYSCPWKSLVYDAGASGAAILNMVSGGDFTNYPLTRASGVHIDYLNGRVLVPTSFGPSLALTGYAAVSELNLYLPNSTEEQLLTQSKYFRNPRYQGMPTSGIDPYAMVTPAVFLNTLNDTSEAFALGGLDNTTTTFSLTCFTETDYQLKGLFSIFRDARFAYMPLLPMTSNPLDGYNDTKGGSGGYNYQSLIAQYGSPGQLIYIASVHTSKVSDRMQLNPGLFAGIIDMDLSYVRQP